MGGKRKEPTITQAPTKTPEQTQLLSTLLGMMGNYMGGESAFGSMPTLGERYGGGRTGRTSTGDSTEMAPSPGGGGKGTTPGGVGQGRQMRGARGSPLDKILTEPIVGSFRQGQTGNFSKRRQ